MLNDGYIYREIVGTTSARTALDHLANRYRHSPRSEWLARFERGEVRINGVAAEPSAPLVRGQELCWHRPPWDEPAVPRSFELIYEDPDLVAVAKPSGLPTCPSGGFLRNTLLHVVRERWPEASPLHRLGRGTSGLVLFARNAPTAARLSTTWCDGDIEKRYRALGRGIAQQNLYEITAPIGLVPHPKLGTVYGANIRGKGSHTSARVLERREDNTLFEVLIHTGRPDQIRIHLAFIGHPLVGDALFGVGGVPISESPALPGDPGYLLHAETLAFTHPRTGQRIHLQAPPPLILADSR